MTRPTTLEVDEALLEDAQRALGTTGLKDTVDEAPAKLTELARATVAGELYDRDPELLRAARS